jgi:hypothetical protein
MGSIKPPLPAKLILGMLACQPDLFNQAVDRLVMQFGEIDSESPIFPFEHTAYYSAEMGQRLKREWVSFEQLISQDSLPRIKLLTNELEGEFADYQADTSKRRINLDPGYLTDSKLVLATTKDYTHRLYLEQGIYGEVTLHYSRPSGWQPFDWTYPDYRQPGSLEFFKQVRQIYLKQRKNHE